MKTDNTIIIDDVEYNLDTLSDEAKNIIGNLSVVDNMLRSKEIELNVIKTAKLKLLQDLKSAISSSSSS